MEEVNAIITALENGDEKGLETIIQSLLDKGLSPSEIINDNLIVAMNDIGVRFRNNILFVPEVLISARTMNAALQVLAPYFPAGNYASHGRILLGTVKDDLHDIGKNIVKMMFTSCGFEVIDLGIDVPTEKFIDGIREHKPDILAMSALLTNTLHQMEVVLEALEKEGIRDQVRVLVGGAPVSQEYADKIGADGFAPDAALAVEVARKLLAGG